MSDILEPFPVGNANHFEHVNIVMIDDKWKVLDVGSGYNPHPRANIIMDDLGLKRDVFNDREILVDSRFVDGNVEDMPFKDNEFDYVLCLHVLEHVNDPLKACKEIIRVGKRGYIETPSQYLELIVGSSDHQWILSEDGHTLKFRRKTDFEKARLDNFIKNIFYNNKYGAKEDLLKMFFKYWKDFYTCFRWEDEFEVEVMK